MPRKSSKTTKATTTPTATAPLNTSAAAFPADPQTAALAAALHERRQMRDALEEYEQKRARTPLALKLEIVSCRWAREHYDAGKTFPTIIVPAGRCWLGKTTTDQDCRCCSQVKLVPYGINLPPHERRYHEHGMVIPIPDEETSDALAEALHEANLLPLRRVDAEIAALEQELLLRDGQVAEQQRRANLEAQQRGEPR